MTCPRCNGLLVKTEVFDLLGRGYEAPQLMCVMCGNRLDPMIEANRGRVLNDEVINERDASRHFYAQSMKETRG